MRNDESPGASEHHLQLFDSSKSLADAVTVFLLAGFERGEPLLVVATPQHRELLAQRLAGCRHQRPRSRGGVAARDARRRTNPRQVHAPERAEPRGVRRSGRHDGRAHRERPPRVHLRRDGRRAGGARQLQGGSPARDTCGMRSAAASRLRCSAATHRATSAIRRAPKRWQTSAQLTAICTERKTICSRNTCSISGTAPRHPPPDSRYHRPMALTTTDRFASAMTYAYQVHQRAAAEGHGDSVHRAHSRRGGDRHGIRRR